MNHKKNLLLVALVLLTFFVISFLTNILGAINPAVSESFQLSETMAGFLPFSFFIAYGIMSIPAGFLVERLGEKTMMLIAFCLAFGGSFLFATHPSVTIFIISLFTIGAGMAILQVVINPLLRVSGGEENYAFFSVFAQLVFGLASFVSPWVYSYLVTGIANGTENLFITTIQELVPASLSWVSIYWVFVLLAAIMVLVIAFTPFPKVQLNKDEQIGKRSTYIGLFKTRIVMLYFLGIFAYVGAEQGISFWMSKFLQITHGIDPNTLGAAAVANFWGLMTIGGILGLVLLKIWDSKAVLKYFTLLAAIALVTALFGDKMLAYYSFQASGFFLSVMYPIIISLALNSLDKNHGTFAGILMTGIVGGAVVQLLIGFVSDLTSLKFGMGIIFICLAYIFSISFWANPLVSNKTTPFRALFSKQKEKTLSK